MRWKRKGNVKRNAFVTKYFRSICNLNLNRNLIQIVRLDSLPKLRIRDFHTDSIRNKFEIG